MVGCRQKDDLIIYHDDDNKVVSKYVKILDLNPTFVRVRLNNTIITIPASRVVKVKEVVASE